MPVKIPQSLRAMLEDKALASSYGDSEPRNTSCHRFVRPTHLHDRRPSKHSEPDLQTSTLPPEKENTAFRTLIS
jgi:hypothetical protein